MSGLFTPVPTGMVLTSGANSALTWTNAVSVSSMTVSSLGANALTVSTLTTSTSVTSASLAASSLVTSSITANSVGYSTLSGSTINATRLNYSSIVGSSISSNAMTLSLTNASTQNTQIYQVATTNPTTSYTAIQASHVSTGTTNNALVLNPSGGNVGVGDTAPSQLLSIFGTGTPAMLIKSNSGGTSGNTASIYLSNAAYNMGTIQAIENANGYGGTWGSELTFATNYSNAMNERMRITARGNVGIGTTAPATALQVNGAVTSLQYTITVNTTGSIVVIANTAANILFASYGNGVWLVTAHATSMTNPQGGSTVSATAYVAINANTPTFANVFGGANSQAAAMTIISNGYGVSLSIGNAAGYGTYRVNFLQIN